MNFLDALKSGKRFRRKGEKNWNDNKLFHDFMSEDWEVEEPTVTITAEQFNSAWDKAFSVDASTVERHIIMCRELGL